jgi:hypothetical protein
MNFAQLLRWIGYLILLCSLASCTSGTPGSSDLPTSTAQSDVCNLSRLTGTATWQGATGTLAGVLTLTNYTNLTCKLQGRPRISIRDQAGQNLSVQLLAGDSSGEVLWLDPEQAASAEFVWRNWCGTLPQGTVYLTVTLPGHPGQLTVEVLDPNGRPMADTPRCDADGSASTLNVGTFK